MGFTMDRVELCCLTVCEQVVAVEVHDFVPRANEITDKLLLGVGAGIDLRKGAELGMRAEDEVGCSCCPPHLAGLAINALVDVLLGGGGPPGGSHIEEIIEEVVGERARPVCEDAMVGAAVVGVQGAHSSD